MLLIALFFLGLLLGSFLNAWLWRAHAGRSVLRGRSLCPHCLSQLAWFDNIPLVSYVVLGARCRTCRARISASYPCIELWMALVSVFIGWVHGSDALLIARDITIVFFLTFIFVFDVRHRLIHDATTLIPAAILFVSALLFEWQTLLSMLIGVVIAAGFFALQHFFSHGRWIGAGDMRLGVLMGVILGWPLTLVALFVAYVGGAAIFLPFIVSRRVHTKTAVPFGALLTAATFVALFWEKNSCPSILIFVIKPTPVKRVGIIFNIA